MALMSCTLLLLFQIVYKHRFAVLNYSWREFSCVLLLLLGDFVDCVNIDINECKTLF